jgi:RNA recognition motif-containing protein
LYNYFLKYGTIKEFSILYDKKTGNSKGYGFVIFDDRKSVDMVLRNKNSHSIRGKWIDCKPAYDKNQEEENLFNEENSDFEGKFFF